MADDAFITPFMDDYFAECEEHLAEIRRLLVEVASRPSRADAAAALRRSYDNMRDPANSIDPLNLPPNLMRGMQAYVAAQAACL